MGSNSDWLPSSKTAMVEMANSWGTKFAVHGQAWGVPDAATANLAGKAGALQTLIATPAAERTPTMNAQIMAAKKTLADVMRDIKKRHFFVPPMTDADLVSLGLKPKDTVATPIAAPMVRPVAIVKLKGAGAFDIHIAPERDISAETKSYYGCKIAYELFEQGAPPPVSEKQLTEGRFIRKKRESFVFQPQDSGKKAYFAMRYENSKGDSGPWCPIFSVLIP